MTKLKRFLSMLTAASMAISMMSTVAFAASGDAVATYAGIVTAVDKSALTAAITDAGRTKDGPFISADGEDIFVGTPWVTQGNVDAYVAAIGTAQAVSDKADATQVEVDQAINDLSAATTIFNNAIKNGKLEATGNRKALLDAAGAANSKLRSIRTSADGTDIPANQKWATRADKDTYRDAIGAAQQVGLDTTKTEDECATALGTLDTASAAFDAACSDGTMTSPTPTPDNDRPSSPSPSENVANTPATVEKVEKTVEAIAELGSIDTAKLPAGVTTATTASGATVAAVPVTLYGGSADLGMEIINTIGGNSKVALNLSISTGLSGSTVKILLPGGFGKITEPGRIGYSFDYKAKADNDEKMLGAVKTEGATSVTAKIGGNHTLPVKATFTVSTKVADGKTVNIYKYDPHTNKLISVGTAKAEGGKLTFSTAIMGEMLFTTGTI